MRIPAAAIVCLSVGISPVLHKNLHHACESSSSSDIYGPLSFVISPINCCTSVLTGYQLNSIILKKLILVISQHYSSHIMPKHFTNSVVEVDSYGFVFSNRKKILANELNCITNQHLFYLGMRRRTIET